MTGLQNIIQNIFCDMMPSPLFKGVNLGGPVELEISMKGFLQLIRARAAVMVMSC